MLDKSLPILPIVRPTFPPLESIAERFAECLRTGQVTNGGRYVEEFEAALTEYLGVPTICFSSGMAALVAMLMVEGVENQEVILPSLTFCATPHAVKLAGGIPVFADVLPDRLTIDPADVRRKITIKTKAILGVDAYGVCCDYDSLMMSHPLLVDSAPAFGSKIGVIPTGRFGRAQIFSFHATKFMSSMEGGCLCSSDRDFISKAKSIRNFGQEDGECVGIGFNAKMLEVCALIGLENLKTIRDRATKRIYSAYRLDDSLRGIGGITFVNSPKNQSTCWTYRPILVDPDIRQTVVQGLIRDGVAVRTYYSACHKMRPYFCGQSLPVTEMAAASVVALMVYDDMSESEINKVSSSIRRHLHG